MSTTELINMLDLPDVALEKIFSFMTYDEIAKNRVVCRKFDQMGQKLLNRGFLQVERRHAAVLRRVKSMLPRRESERRLHQLSRHCDILTAIETRISMLNMTFSKYIEWNVACFIPGKVLDEIERVLTLVETSNDPPRTHELLQELRDISSMAMEHFDEHIIPIVRKKRETMSLSIPMVIPSHGILKGPVGMVMVEQNFRQELTKVTKRSRHHKYQLQAVRRHLNKLNARIKRQSAHLAAQSSRIREQEAKIAEQQTKIQEQENAMTELKRHMEEWDQKFADLTAELSRSRVIATSPPPGSIAKKQPFTTTVGVSPPKIYKPNIKPRMAQVYRPVSLVASISQELERKRKLGEWAATDSTGASTSAPPPPKAAKNIAAQQQEDEDPDANSIANVGGGGGLTREDNSSIAKEKKTHIGKFLDLTLESLIKSPISSIRARKRKYVGNLV